MRSLLLVALVLALLPAAATAQRASEQRRWSIDSGIGFTAHPDAFLMGFEADYRIVDGFSAGGELQLGLNDGFTLVSPFAHLRYSLDLRRMGASEALGRLRPFFQGGVGFTYINVDVPNVPGVNIDDDDIGFLMNFGFGGDFRLNRSWSVGSKMLFNILPANVMGRNFYYSWEVGSLRYRF